MDEVILFLIICLLGCIIYIIWLHREQNKRTLNKTKVHKEEKEPEDSLSFLKSEYSASELSKGGDDVLDGEIDEIIGDE